MTGFWLLSARYPFGPPPRLRIFPCCDPIKRSLVQLYEIDMLQNVCYICVGHVWYLPVTCIARVRHFIAKLGQKLASWAMSMFKSSKVLLVKHHGAMHCLEKYRKKLYRDKSEKLNALLTCERFPRPALCKILDWTF